MKLRPVIEVTEMAEFVDNHVITQVLRETHQIEVEIDIPFGGTAAPIGDIMLDADLIVAESILLPHLS